MGCGCPPPGGFNSRDPRTGKFTQVRHDSKNPRSLATRVSRRRRGRRKACLGGHAERPRPARLGRPRLHALFPRERRRRTASLITGYMAAPRGVAAVVDRRRWGRRRSVERCERPLRNFRSRRWRAAPAGLTTSLQFTRRPMARCGSAPATDWSCSTRAVARQSASTWPNTRARSHRHDDATRIATGVWIATMEHGVLVVDLATGEWTRAHSGERRRPGQPAARSRN